MELKLSSSVPLNNNDLCFIQQILCHNWLALNSQKSVLGWKRMVFLVSLYTFLIELDIKGGGKISQPATIFKCRKQLSYGLIQAQCQPYHAIHVTKFRFFKLRKFFGFNSRKLEWTLADLLHLHICYILISSLIIMR